MRPGPLVATVATTLTALAAVALQACASPGGSDASRSFTTHHWVLTEADRLAAERGADWLDLDEALRATADPDAVLTDLLHSAADLPEGTLDSSRRRITHLYRSALADLAAGDGAAASF